MTTFHAAVVHADRTVTYCGTVDEDHVDAVRAHAELAGAPRHVRDHPEQPGVMFVLRDDGNLDWYVPVDRPAASGGSAAGRQAGAERTTHRERTDAEEGAYPAPRAATGPDYVDGAVRFGGQVIGGAMDHPENPPRAVWHTTESPAGANFFTSMANFLISVASEPQVIYDPVTDKVGQFGPMRQSARALRNDGTRRTNREGLVCIQVEVLGHAAEPFTDNFDPASKPNFRKLLAAMRAHGIPDNWPAGEPVPTETSPMPRPRAVWQGQGGHFGHCHVPGNTHWDPGAISTGIVPGTP
ncbi:hypothetical protein ACFYYR_17485 [Streptomyces sp. NPDC001922]|uniref:hypothetical protein n=1 Tax=Streptomyces sp. NPDC001922 TaxID=3364624 RepID=UPI0036C8C4A3